MGSSGPLFGTAVLLSAYLVSGIFQPILVDVVRYMGGEGSRSPPTLLPMLFSCIGMSVAGAVQCRRWTLTEWKTLRQVGFWVLVIVDFLSGVFIYAGLEVVGSGTFILIYASCLPWTAVLSRCLLKTPIPRHRWIGVGIITLGLSTTALQSFLEVEAEQAGLVKPPKMPTPTNAKHHALIVYGSALVFLGSFFHALMFVLGELVLGSGRARTSAASERTVPASGTAGNILERGHAAATAPNDKGPTKPSPLFMCTILGILESTALVVYNLALYFVHGADVLYLNDFKAHGHHTFYVLSGIVGLLIVNGIHSSAFFFLLQLSGAVSMGVLKGIMTLCVFVFAAVFLCRFQPEQCLTPIKFASCALIVTGSFVYYGVRVACRDGRCQLTYSSAFSSSPTPTPTTPYKNEAHPSSPSLSSPQFAETEPNIHGVTEASESQALLGP